MPAAKGEQKGMAPNPIKPSYLGGTDIQYIVNILYVYFPLLPRYLRGKAQLMRLWLQEMFTSCTHPCNLPRWIFLAVPLASSLGSHPSGKTAAWLLTSEIQTWSFWKHGVSDVYKSAGLHFGHPLRNQIWQTWVCALSPGGGWRKQEQLCLREGVKGMKTSIYPNTQGGSSHSTEYLG